jgi:hypothetical protein
LGCFILVRRIESVAGRAARHRCLGDFLSLIEAAASGDCERDLKVSEMSAFESLRKE